MANFDQVFAELSAKMAAAIQVIAQYPDVAAEVRAAIDGAQTAAEIVEGQAQDDARANALKMVIADAGSVLSEALPGIDFTVTEPTE
jgi:hypothetical protein